MQLLDNVGKEFPVDLDVHDVHYDSDYAFLNVKLEIA